MAKMIPPYISEKDKDNEYRSQLYVAMSRAKVCLYVLADKSCEEDCNRLLKRVKKVVTDLSISN
ncbi:MAG: hypothetical protein ABRQ39_32590 [Candidatus Eremiobacterota bacterium]